MGVTQSTTAAVLAGSSLVLEFGVLGFELFLLVFDMDQLGFDGLNDLALSRNEQYLGLDVCRANNLAMVFVGCRFYRNRPIVEKTLCLLASDRLCAGFRVLFVADVDIGICRR
jgi:hypothetical protein